MAKNQKNQGFAAIRDVVSSSRFRESRVDIRLNSLVDEIRTDIGKEYPVGNVGAAITDIEGVTSEIKAYSKINNSISSPNTNHEY